jgi:hypothetical protein
MHYQRGEVRNQKARRPYEILCVLRDYHEEKHVKKDVFLTTKLHPHDGEVDISSLSEWSTSSQESFVSYTLLHPENLSDDQSFGRFGGK